MNILVKVHQVTLRPNIVLVVQAQVHAFSS